MSVSTPLDSLHRYFIGCYNEANDQELNALGEESSFLMAVRPDEIEKMTSAGEFSMDHLVLYIVESHVIKRVFLELSKLFSANSGLIIGTSITIKVPQVKIDGTEMLPTWMVADEALEIDTKELTISHLVIKIFENTKLTLKVAQMELKGKVEIFKINRTGQGLTETLLLSTGSGQEVLDFFAKPQMKS